MLDGTGEEIVSCYYVDVIFFEEIAGYNIKLTHWKKCDLTL
ncbi:MAG: hypothetical protein ABIN04_00105 [Ginsengibacter sp.]